MGSNTLPTETASVIQKSHVNKFQEALAQDLPPRNTSGVPTDIAGSLGTDALNWLKAHIASGYWVVGDVKAHHTYGGALDPGEGWMLCNGDIVNQANYDALHGAGHWATYVGTSPLDGKYLPNMADRFIKGKSTTAQDGSVAIVHSGNASNTIDLLHAHTDPGHTHGMSHDHGFNSGTDFGGVGTGKAYRTGVPSAVNTDPGVATMSNQLSATTDITPDSHDFQIYMRII